MGVWCVFCQKVTKHSILFLENLLCLKNSGEGSTHQNPPGTQTLPLLTIYVWHPETLSCMEIYLLLCGHNRKCLVYNTRRDGRQGYKESRQTWDHQTQNALVVPLGMSASAPHFRTSTCSQILRSWGVATRQWVKGTWRGRWESLRLHKFFPTAIRDTRLWFLRRKWTATLVSAWIKQIHMEVSDYPSVLTVGADLFIRLFGEAPRHQSLSNQAFTWKIRRFYLVVAHFLLRLFRLLWILGNTVLYHK